MSASLSSSAPAAVAVPPADRAPPPAANRPADDLVLIRAAAKLTRELHLANPRVYWSDLLASVLLGYGALAATILLGATAAKLGFGVIAILALYRAGSFIHELTHMKPSSVPGFNAGWNALVGVPLMVPSFLYENIHTLHHQRTRYGTELDPEYLPLALMRPWTLPVFLLVSILAPLGLVIRFALLAPLSALLPSLRRAVVTRFSALAIEPRFRRKPPEGPFRAAWLRQEIATSVWTIGLLALVIAGVIPWQAYLTYLVVISGVAVLNQVRTLVAHLWENDGEAISVTAQYLDTVNVPPPGFLPALWAPVGLRYHALHHLLPSIPYHALAEAHRRLVDELPHDNVYHQANHAGLFGLVHRLHAGTLRAKA